MTLALAIPATLPATASPPPGARWIDVKTAAQRLGISERRIVQLCAQKWLGSNVARQLAANGRKPRWEVNESADPGLSPVRFPEQMPIDLRTLSDEHRRDFEQRQAIYRGWLSALDQLPPGKTERQATARYLQHVGLMYRMKLSRPTLYRWHERYRRDGDTGLIDQRWCGNAGGPSEKITDPFLAEVERLYLDLNKPSMQLCYDRAEAEAWRHGWTVPSYATARRHVKKIPLAILHKLRGGEKLFNDLSASYIERDYSTLQSNELWCGDHHQFDVIVRDGGKHVRPWLTAWQDLRSRKIVGWEIFGHDPNTDTILSAFRRGARECGVPKAIYVDHGKDYSSYALNGCTKAQRRRRRFKVPLEDHQGAGVFHQLQVEVRHCEPYHGQSKPIERLFRTLCERFSKQFQTYCGNKPSEKPEGLAERLDKGLAPGLSAFVAKFNEWLTSDYHARPHEGDSMDGKTPDQVFAECLVSKRTATDEQLDLFMQKCSRPVKVGRNGVRCGDLNYGQRSAALWDLTGQSVVIRSDSNDASSVTVWTLDDQFICRAECNERLPPNATPQELRAAKTEIDKSKRAHAEYFNHRRRAGSSIADIAFEQRAERAAAAALPPPSIQPVRSTLTDQLPALRRAMPKRGAEAEREAAEVRRLHDDFLNMGEALARKMDAEREAEDAREPLTFTYVSKVLHDAAERELA
jgi:hypothetical protein